ncbi:1-acyl-sn-glycerol-3-phosphate acyltransferase [Polaribacter vadi]|uniref:1-acyl-sn-glycerol-3-phosphate acyltransferase n=1 Tax=Polaribacter TaxID=52959 RepID=UPI001C08278B|nr:MULTISPECIES: 1-acyl-sn-glycerol-3-phosphate acyltransferase [Polaribacter]MBU3011833.1 1-acyl-sn-glycerol-3-phosphate acyltransferase [Polaribacter vadi]MDO6741647.1 1-acyl-sn-glycerol-3-phosphate acyltransferase [Polaribacter sp. 1_MG-2023]
MIKKIWYQSVKAFLKISLNFYANKIKISGKENIPKKGAVLFAINHPNALMDPLFVTTFNPRENHFLVRADVFKKPLIKKALGSLNLMPIYRIRDGRKQLSNNEEVFEKCFKILKNKETLIIFPQGGHSRDRNIKPLSKGFTRIVFGALEQNPDLEIAVIPVGITYQNSSSYPCKVAVNFGKAIDSRAIFNDNEKPKAINILKIAVSSQLQKLTVHIPDDENYQHVLSKLNKANVDFTKVAQVNKMIAENSFPKPVKKTANLLKVLFYMVLLNGVFPYLLWKKMKKNIQEIEFVDTMRYAVNVIAFPVFYLLQALLIYFFFGLKIALGYWFVSYFLVFVYTKFSVVNTEE